VLRWTLLPYLLHTLLGGLLALVVMSRCPEGSRAGDLKSEID
jgi:hypothetical protein